jgi:hypothetical protein
MNKVIPIEKEWTIHGDIKEVNSFLVKALQSLKGRVHLSEENYIQCDFGSLFLSRFIGEFWVSRATLPKRAEIHLERLGESETSLRMLVKDTHKFGFKIGYVEKYQQALQEISDSIYQSSSGLAR